MKPKELKQNLLRFLGNFVLTKSIDVLCKSLKISYINKEVIDELEKKNSNYVLAFWHGTMLLPWYFGRNKSFAALTSKSKYGDLLAKLLKHWNYKVVRGSSSSGGDIALGIMIDYAKNKYTIAITPDGPKGPPYKMKAGAVITAKKTGIPLVLAGVGFRKKRILKSWDKFEVPKFFTKAKIIFSDPVYLDKDLSYDDTSKIIEECEEKLRTLQLNAGKF